MTKICHLNSPLSKTTISIPTMEKAPISLLIIIFYFFMFIKYLEFSLKAPARYHDHNICIVYEWLLKTSNGTLQFLHFDWLTGNGV